MDPLRKVGRGIHIWWLRGKSFLGRLSCVASSWPGTGWAWSEGNWTAALSMVQLGLKIQGAQKFL